MKEYNTTQLDPLITFEKHIFHRDQFAHYLRWTYVLNIAKIGMNILDFGCGSGNLAEVLYRNKFKCKKYLGLDIRKELIDKNIQKFFNVDWIAFNNNDLCHKNLYITGEWDIITCFEVIEHIGKKNRETFLENIRRCMNKDTILLISTPVYDESVGAANNHIINNEINEMTYREMEDLLITNGFEIQKVFGTFASQKDYKPYMNEWQKEMFNKLNEYYDSNLISNIMAPMFPEQSRNCLWICKLNQKEDIK